MGSNVVGVGFLLPPEKAQELIEKNPRNAVVLFPFMNGEDINSNPTQTPSRWTINFFNWPLERASDYPDCLAILREKVYPERINKPGGYSTYWWQFGRRQERLYEALSSQPQALVCSQTTKYLSFVYVESGYVYSHKVIVFALGERWQYGVLQSNFHEAWARKYCSTLETRLSYTPTDGFETFPFPKLPASSNQLPAIGETYHEHRRQIMLARQEGLTATYNRFHNPDERAADIARLRQLHIELDRTVAAAYGWDDLALGHGFHETAQGVRYTISEAARREVLARLLELNHQRYAEEVAAGMHEKKGITKTRSSAKARNAKVAKDDSGALKLF